MVAVYVVTLWCMCGCSCWLHIWRVALIAAYVIVRWRVCGWLLYVVVRVLDVCVRVYDLLQYLVVCVDECVAGFFMYVSIHDMMLK